MLLVRAVSAAVADRERADAARAARVAATARGARILSIGIASTGRRHVRVLLASPSTRSTTSTTRRISLLWSVMFVIISVIYRPIEQLLSRTIADRRARGLRDRPPAAHAAADPGRLRAGVPGRRAGAAGRRSQDDLFDGSAALYWVLVVGVLAYAASYFARGWLAGHQWFGLYGGLVFMEATLAAAVRARGGDRDRRRARPRWRWAWRRRRSCRSSSCRSAFARRPQATARRGRARRGGARPRPRRALRGRRAGDHARRADAAQRRRADRRRRPRPTPRSPASSSTRC